MKNIKNVVILGSTGSIGSNTLDVINDHPDKLNLFCISGFSNIDKLAYQSIKYKSEFVIVPDQKSYKYFSEYCKNKYGFIFSKILIGNQALIDIVSDSYCDIVVSAIVGLAGLSSTLAAANAGKKILLANKESLVAAGHLFMNSISIHKAEIIPIDSEHNAIFQCLNYSSKYNKNNNNVKYINKLWLTASGGPFRLYTTHQLQNVTAEDTCKHPTWKMGKKISVDSATLFNKCLEIIESYWLFNIDYNNIDVLVHPQSIVHAIVEYIDGSSLAQLSNPDMRIPISYALGFPERIHNKAFHLDLSKVKNLEFYKPDIIKFPCLSLYKTVLNIGQGGCVAMNAANEIAVNWFLKNTIKFTSIYLVIIEAINWYIININKFSKDCSNLDEILLIDNEIRKFTESFISKNINKL
ncbi:1-deoxy-D-xylulose-5-phosphate reductoisomerase [Candidatus Kinetoplastibacterium sorsogonicusi]|uniref:1-deoxy-D-xylulose-5-phosphate reductoisomerase n=1 Tax=Candidatus Kinetoplastidibacterium kentomonadis TaxID=1576550 RepID=UPI001374F411|nr:1-deoxy-D-xylulose-5-phosphate reductoisomerase [Candidatus Kinetoplastibacterium sorsogonicusi]